MREALRAGQRVRVMRKSGEGGLADTVHKGALVGEGYDGELAGEGER